MKKEIKVYIEELSQKAAEPDTDKTELAKQLLIRIGFYQHERLIHLIVTMSFAVFFLLSILMSLQNPAFWALSALLLILLVPYIGHYYYLENSVQRLYQVYYKITDTGTQWDKANN